MATFQVYQRYRWCQNVSTTTSGDCCSIIFTGRLATDQ